MVCIGTYDVRGRTDALAKPNVRAPSEEAPAGSPQLLPSRGPDRVSASGRKRTPEGLRRSCLWAGRPRRGDRIWVISTPLPSTPTAAGPRRERFPVGTPHSWMHTASKARRHRALCLWRVQTALQQMRMANLATLPFRSLDRLCPGSNAALWRGATVLSFLKA